MLDIPSGVASLKTYFSDDKVEEIAFGANPALAIIPKFTTWTGQYFNEALLYEDVMGSATFSNAQANGGQFQAAQFQLSEVEDYVVAQIANRIILASGDDRGAFLRAASTTVASALRHAGRSLGQALFLNGQGTIGQVSVITGNVITLTDVTQSVNFSVGMTLDAIAYNGTSIRAGTMLVTAIDRANGLITCAGGLIAGLTANTGTTGDFLIRDGDFGKKITGFRGWLPFPGDNGSTAPGRLSATDSFFNVNRNNDVTRLAGWYQDCRGLPLPEAIEQTAEYLVREEGEPDYLFFNPATVALLKNQLGGKVVYESVEAFKNPQISFPSVRFEGPAGPIKIVADRQCPVNQGFMMTMKTWTLRLRGKAPRIISYDMEGLEALRIWNQDGIELRVGYYGQLGCSGPGMNAIMQLL
jgi:hypothetical protein